MKRKWLIFFHYGDSGNPEYTGDSFDKYTDASNFVQHLMEAQNRLVTFLIIPGGAFQTKHQSIEENRAYTEAVRKRNHANNTTTY